jgi:hypothetical protein
MKWSTGIIAIVKGGCVALTLHLYGLQIDQISWWLAMLAFML